MVRKIVEQIYLWILLLLLYAPIFIIVVYSFTEAKVLGNWTGFSWKLYRSLLDTGAHHSLMNALVNTIAIALIAAAVSTILGSVAAIGIFNLRTRSRKAMGFINSDFEWGHHYGCVSVPAVCFFGYYAGVYHCSLGTYHFLYPLRGTLCDAPVETDESESV